MCVERERMIDRFYIMTKYVEIICYIHGCVYSPSVTRSEIECMFQQREGERERAICE